jgi:hypothetical protein
LTTPSRRLAPLPPNVLLLDEQRWRSRQERHVQRVSAWVAPRLTRRRVGLRHPVDDFLFEYYPYRPSHLAAWHPGRGVGLTGPGAVEFLQLHGYVLRDGVVHVDGAAFTQRLPRALRIRTLLETTRQRPAEFGCLGRHEWAMVYSLDQQQVRHHDWPLRLSPDEIADVVTSGPLNCTHFDAYRFFTPPARSLNLIDLTREDQAKHEQPGCLHANMDLYKWAYKLSPLVGSDLIADAFELARELRELDMRASPYDLSALGYQPIPIERAEGRAMYIAEQRRCSKRAQTLRAKLLTEVELILETLTALRKVGVDQLMESLTVE